MLKAIRTAHAASKDWKNTLQSFLIDYWSTKHTTTKESTVQLLFNIVQS